LATGRVYCFSPGQSHHAFGELSTEAMWMMMMMVMMMVMMMMIIIILAIIVNNVLVCIIV
jgi:hypothetical protein